MSEWQTPQNLTSISTSCGPSARRPIEVRRSGDLTDGAAYALTVNKIRLLTNCIIWDNLAKTFCCGEAMVERRHLPPVIGRMY
jgi:hypothetical protein